MPGSVKEETCRGSNGLIKDGAKLVEQAQDILDEILPQIDVRLREVLSADEECAMMRKPPEPQDAQVYEALSSEARSIDAVIERTGLNAAKVASSLLSLELSGHVRQLPGQQYVRL